MDFSESKSGLMLPVEKPAVMKSATNPYQGEVLVAQWERFCGCNFEKIDTKGKSIRGHFSCATHLGEPLTQELWEDLVYRVRIQSLWVIGHNQEEWTMAQFPPAALVRLDENELVRDVELTI